MKYMAVGSAMINDIYYADGGKLLGQLGGGGLYGTFGLRLWDDEVKFTASAGRDFKTYFGPWFARNNLTTAGVREKLDVYKRQVLHTVFFISCKIMTV